MASIEIWAVNFHGDGGRLVETIGLLYDDTWWIPQTSMGMLGLTRVAPHHIEKLFRVPKMAKVKKIHKQQTEAIEMAEKIREEMPIELAKEIQEEIDKATAYMEGPPYTLSEDRGDEC